MFKYSSSKNYLNLFCAALLLLAPQIYAQGKNPDYKSISTVDYIIDEQHIMSFSDSGNWVKGEILPLISQNEKIGVFAYVEVASVRPISNIKYEIRLRLVRQSRRYLIQQGDYVKRINLEEKNNDYVGTTDLLVRSSPSHEISSKYKPLVYQGFFIGETAQTLYKNEWLVNFYGNTYYGLTEELMVGSLIPYNIINGLNASAKYKVYDSDSTTLSTSLNYTDVRSDKESILNFNLYWDSLSSESMISHFYLSVALLRWKGDADVSIIKSLGSSSFQTGYEIVMTDWDRFLVGPSYNFDTKALGGYLSYVWIFDRFHAQLSLNTTNIVKLRAKDSNQEGYFGFFDLYWRF